MTKRHLRLPAALCALAFLLSAHTVQAQRQRIAAARAMPVPYRSAPPPLERGEERLRVRVVDLQGKPVPGARVAVARLSDPEGEATTDENGVAVLENLPDQEVVLHIGLPYGGMFPKHTRPGEIVVVVPDQAILQSLGREPFGSDAAWKVARWVAGTPVSPEDAKAGGYLLCFPVAATEIPLDETVGFLVDLHKKHRRTG